MAAEARGGAVASPPPSAPFPVYPTAHPILARRTLRRLASGVAGWQVSSRQAMTQQGATLQNYNNELVKCAHAPT